MGQQELMSQIEKMKSIGERILAQLEDASVSFESIERSLCERETAFEKFQEAVEMLLDKRELFSCSDELRRILQQNARISLGISERREGVRQAMAKVSASQRFAKSSLPTVQGRMVDIEL
ncbi:hypothetical protein AAC03nite_24410 [Alicyclobacillus acidoterrestris]|nr:hypothetical protein AAC03nite_24410 [Alicyclobacillus acidoterrestris]